MESCPSEERISSWGCGGRTCVIVIGSPPCLTRVLVVLARWSPLIPLISSNFLTPSNKSLLYCRCHPVLNYIMLPSSPTIHSNESAYTLATVQHSEIDESSSLLNSSSESSSAPLVSYGTAPVHPPHHTRRVIFNATLKMALLFVLSCIFLGGTLWIALPTLEPYVITSLSCPLL